MIDLSLAADFEQYFTQPFANQDEAAVEMILRHPRTIIAQSDSGAHVSQLMDSSIPTHFLAHWVRDRQAFSWEEGIHMLTGRPAREWGLGQRGHLAEGRTADLVVIDPGTVGPRLPYARADLPAGGTRLVQEADGMHATWWAASSRAWMENRPRPGPAGSSGARRKAVRASSLVERLSRRTSPPARPRSDRGRSPQSPLASSGR